MSRVHLDTCGCFPMLPRTPRAWNRAGLDAIEYGIADYASVLARLRARLDSAAGLAAAEAPATAASGWVLIDDAIAEELPPGEAFSGGSLGVELAPLASLTTREPDDPAIALLDAFACVTDVLTFYQERIANEGFLRTANERRSLLELARLIGYELSPGVAAQAWLAFQVEERGADAPISVEPPRTTIPARTRIQSVPSGGELPQTFETSRDFVARAEWNAMRPQLTTPQPLDTGAQTIYVKGTATRLEAGDWLVVAEGTGTGPITGVPQAYRVQRVTVEPTLDRVRVDLVDEPATVTGAVSTGHGTGVVLATDIGFARTEVDGVLGSAWSNEALTTFLEVQGWPLGAFFGYAEAPPPPVPTLPAAAPGVYALRRSAGVFGHNAPRCGAALIEDGWLNWDSPARGVNATTEDSQVASGAVGYPHGLDLEAVFPGVVPGSWAVLVDSVAGSRKVVRIGDSKEHSRADYALSGKVTHVDLIEPDGSNATGLTSFGLRTTTVHCESERLELAELPLPEAVTTEDEEVTLDRLVLGLETGQPVALAGEDAELDGVRWAEVSRLTDVTHAGGRTTLHLQALEHSYKRSTLTINGNVAEATHGETVEEALGSGDGSPRQRHRLRKPPLTYVSAASSSGTESTLEVWVDGVLWTESRGFVGLGARDERYVVRRDDAGVTSVLFGDGERGARPPSGLENVRARYRSGIGSGGLVGAGALTLMQTRPPLVREVINPLPAEGAEDAEDRDSARSNAPLTVTTLDRVVSLRDHEDFARAFAGIAKARATQLWLGERRVVHVTIAGPGAVAVSDDTRAKLLEALRGAGDPGVQVRLGSFRKVPFELSLSVLLDGRRVPETVLGTVRSMLVERFSFDRREFGQAVTEAEIVSVALGVPGVVDVRVDVLRPIPTSGPLGPAKQDPLLVHPARWSTSAPGEVEPAELAILSPIGPALSERKEP
jgi:hypothetical protein